MRWIVLSLTSIAGLLAMSAPAAAQGTSRAMPDAAGAASALYFDVDGLAPPLDGRLPSALEMNAPPGFRLNLKALGKRCGEEAAKLNECPAASRMGTGLLHVIVTAPDGVREVNIPLNVYLHSRTRVLAVAFVFGWRVVPGTVRAGDDGVVLDFDPLPAGPAFEGVSYALKRIWFDFRAKRTIKQRKVRRVNGKRRVRIVKRRVTLVTNPRDCEGSWAASITLRFPDGAATPLSTPMACST